MALGNLYSSDSPEFRAPKMEIPHSENANSMSKNIEILH